MDGKPHLLSKPKGRKRTRGTVNLWLKSPAHRAPNSNNEWKPHWISVRTSNYRCGNSLNEKALVTKVRIITDRYRPAPVRQDFKKRVTFTRHPGRTLATSLLDFRNPRIQGHEFARRLWRIGYREKKLHIFSERFNRSRSIMLGMRKPHIYIINQPHKIPIRCNRFLSSNHNHHHTHLHHHPHGAPYHQRNHHYRMEHRKKPSCITGGCATLGFQTLSLENNCAWAKPDTRAPIPPSRTRSQRHHALAGLSSG